MAPETHEMFPSEAGRLLVAWDLQSALNSHRAHCVGGFGV